MMIMNFCMLLFLQVQPHNMKETSETTKEQLPLLEDSVIAREPTCDAVGDKSLDEVTPFYISNCSNFFK